MQQLQTLGRSPRTSFWKHHAPGERQRASKPGMRPRADQFEQGSKMSKEAIKLLAKECGATTYTNRHYPDAVAMTFSPLAWEKFCDALAGQPAPAQEKAAPCYKHGDEPKQGCAWCDKQPAQQEPCCHAGIAHDCHAGPGCRIAERLKASPPPQRKPLTDEQIDAAVKEWFEGDYRKPFTKRMRAAIEAAHNIKGQS